MVTKAKSDIDAVMAIEGQISCAEADALATLASKTAPGHDIVEIGSFRGRSSCALGIGSLRVPRNRVFAIDPHTEFIGPNGGHYGPADQEALYANVVRLGLGEIIAVISLPSVRAARAWSAPTVGLLFIDGNHRYVGVRADFEAWYAHVVPGGVIAFHDADMPDVQRVIDQALVTRLAERVGQIDSMCWLKKRSERA